MSTHPSTRQGLRGTLESIMEFFLSKLISSHGKRIIFITSLYFRVVQLERLKSEALVKLNSIMNLAANAEALHLPAAFCGMVWNRTSVADELTAELLDQDITEEQARSLSTRVVDLAPDWVRYDKRSMIADVYELISKGEQLAKGEPLAAAA